MSGGQLDSPGAALAKARESAGITQREVADALHLPVTTIDAIEEGDSERLPAPVFARGYVRAYAKLLELDPDPLIAALEIDQGIEETSTPSAEEQGAGAQEAAPNPLLALTRQPRLVLAGAGGLVVLVILLALLFTGGEEDAAPATVVDAASEPQPGMAQNGPAQNGPAQNGSAQLAQVTPDAIEPSADAADEAAAAPVEFEPAVAPDAAPESAEERVGGGAAEVAATATELDPVVSEVAAATPVDDPDVRRLTPTGGDRLSLVFSEDCWVEIKNTEGSQLYGNLGRAGDTLEFVGAGPFRVLLGYAPGAILLYNDEPIALSPHTRNNVASLVIGQ